MYRHRKEHVNIFVSKICRGEIIAIYKAFHNIARKSVKKTIYVGIGSVCPNYTFVLIIKKYFNEHKAYFNLNYKEVHLYIDLNESLVKEGREYVHLLLISKTI
jgi:hypothetical protein